MICVQDLMDAMEEADPETPVHVLLQDDLSVPVDAMADGWYQTEEGDVQGTFDIVIDPDL